MTPLKSAIVGLGLFLLGGCAVVEPYPAYPSYPAYPPPVVVQPRVYGYWGGGYWGGGHYGHHRGWGRGYGHWR